MVNNSVNKNKIHVHVHIFILVYKTCTLYIYTHACTCTCTYIVHCSLVAVDPNVWLHVIHKLELKPHPLVTDMTNQILSIVYDGMATQPDQSHRSLRTLLRVNEESMIDSVVDKACQVMGAPEVFSVTTEDMEIMMTPPTKLWHRQLWQE